MSNLNATTSNTRGAANTPDPLCHFQDIKDSDITLRCSDEGELHVYMVILSIVSPVFRDMFAFPRPVEDQGDRRIVDITESSRTMEILLQFCYPQENPSIQDLSELHKVLQACYKYQMDAMTKIVANALSAFSRQEPLRVFCIAYSMKLIAEARRAAFDCLRRSEASLIDFDTPELQLLSVSAFVELVRYYRNCVKAATSTVNITLEFTGVHKSWITERRSCWFQCRECQAYYPAICGSPMRITKHSEVTSPRRWWGHLMERVREKLEDSPRNFSAWTSLRFEIPPQILECSNCGPSFLKDLVPFMKEMETAVLTAMRNVKLKLDIDTSS